MKKRIITLMLIVAMVMSVLAGCGSKDADEVGSKAGGDKSSNGIDISKEVKLKMYLLGDRTADFDKVYDEINKILKEKVNATVEVDFLSWSEHDTKYSLLFSSGEEFDLIFTASGWAHYESTSSMGGFYELTEEFIKKYAPDIWAVVPEAAWSQAEINGKVYMVPNYQNEFSADVLAVRGDLMKKYGYEDITSWDELMDFYADIAANEKEITPLGTQGNGLLYPYLLHKGVDIIGGTPAELFVYNMLDPEDLNITLATDWDGFREYAVAAKKMFDSGYWSADSMATTEERQDGFLRGTSASMVWNLGSCKGYAERANKEHPEWECTIIDIAPNTPKGVAPYINNGIAINANSKNKERAMMVLNEFYTNPEVFDLAMLGIEGVHWEAVGDDQYKLLEANANYGVDSNCNWGWTNMTIKRKEYIAEPTDLDKKQEAISDAWNANVKVDHPYDRFSFDNSAVNSEIAAVNTILTQYYTPITYGMVDDVDAAIEELKTQLNKAGIQRIYEEVKRQAEEFVANNK